MSGAILSHLQTFLLASAPLVQSLLQPLQVASITDESRHHPFPSSSETKCSVSQRALGTLGTHRVNHQSAYKSTPQLSNVLSVLNVLLEHTTSALTSVPIRMSDHLYVRFVGRHLPANTTENVTKDSTLVKRNLYVEDNSKLVGHGDVGEDLLAQMHWEDTLGVRLVECVSARYWKRRMLSEVEQQQSSSSSSSSTHSSSLCGPYHPRIHL